MSCRYYYYPGYLRSSRFEDRDVFTWKETRALEVGIFLGYSQGASNLPREAKPFFPSKQAEGL